MAFIECKLCSNSILLCTSSFKSTPRLSKLKPKWNLEEVYVMQISFDIPQEFISIANMGNNLNWLHCSTCDNGNNYKVFNPNALSTYNPMSHAINYYMVPISPELINSKPTTKKSNCLRKYYELAL